MYSRISLKKYNTPFGEHQVVVSVSPQRDGTGPSPQHGPGPILVARAVLLGRTKGRMSEQKNVIILESENDKNCLEQRRKREHSQRVYIGKTSPTSHA